MEFEAWLVMEGYQRTDSLVMVLTDELRGTPKPYEIGLGSCSHYEDWCYHW